MRIRANSEASMSPDAALAWAKSDRSPILRWAGSKRKLLPILAQFWRPRHLRYVEPFAGSSCLFFDLRPQTALLSDKNSELIEMYEVLRDAPAELHKRATAFRQTETNYYRIRKMAASALTKLERAARFVFLNRFCFNGIFRTNASGDFNVPYSPTKTGQIPDLSVFLACSDALQHAQIRCCDFGSAVRHVRAGDFVYLDPPYAVRSRRMFREYGADRFTMTDLERLGKHLVSINKRGASFLLSYADCKESRELRETWGGRRIQVRRHIAGFTGARRSSYELLITNIAD